MIESSAAGAVVVGVDGSSYSDTALVWAATRAEASSRPLRVVHALGSPLSSDLMTGPEVSRTEVSRELAVKEATRITDDARVLARRSAPGLVVDVEIADVDAREALIARSGRAGMVVVGTRGHGRVTSLLLGSVSTAVVAHARGAVAVVRRRETTSLDVVVGIAGDGSDQAALRFAADLACEAGVDLHVLHAWSDHDTFVDTQAYGQRLESVDEHERIASEALAGLSQTHPDLGVRVTFPDDGAARALAERSRTAECLVLGSRGRHGLVGVLGSVSRAVVERAHCTVVVVPAGPGARDDRSR